MSIEVRQFVVRCQVVLPPAAPAAPARTADLQSLREELLAECRALLRDTLQQAKER
jgi:hypothetical protein